MKKFMAIYFSFLFFFNSVCAFSGNTSLVKQRARDLKNNNKEYSKFQVSYSKINKEDPEIGPLTTYAYQELVAHYMKLKRKNKERISEKNEIDCYTSEDSVDDTYNDVHYLSLGALEHQKYEHQLLVFLAQNYPEVFMTIDATVLFNQNNFIKLLEQDLF